MNVGIGLYGLGDMTIKGRAKRLKKAGSYWTGLQNKEFGQT